MEDADYKCLRCGHEFKSPYDPSGDRVAILSSMETAGPAITIREIIKHTNRMIRFNLYSGISPPFRMEPRDGNLFN